MNVLHVIPSIAMAHGGPSLAIRSMERALNARGVDVTTLTTDDAGPGGTGTAGEDAPPPEVERIHFRVRAGFYKFAPGMVPWLWRNVDRFDVVHIHALFSFSSTIAALAAMRARVPYVLRPLGSLTRYGVSRRRPMLKRLSLACVEGPILRHAAAVHFTSEAEQDEAGMLQIPMNGVILPLGIDAVAKGDRTRDQGDMGSEGSPLTILALSRIDPKKNFEGLLEALGLLHREGVNPVLLVGGSGEEAYIRRLRQLAEREGIATQVRWMGHVSGDAKANVFAAADLFVLPSFSENFGLAVVEAMSAGLPCVLGRGVALSERVWLEGAGIVVEPDARSIASGLRRYVTDPEARRAAGTAAEALHRREYSLAAMGERLVALYQSLHSRDLRVSP